MDRRKILSEFALCDTQLNNSYNFLHRAEPSGFIEEIIATIVSFYFFNKKTSVK